MRLLSCSMASTRCLMLLAAAVALAGCRPQPGTVLFEKTTIDPAFRSEGIAVADLNGDGRADLLAGDLWYEAPSWAPRSIAPVREFDPTSEYSDAFIVFAGDLNEDGWMDEVVFGFPNTAPFWRENPGTTGVDWPQHPVFGAAASESPAFAPLNGPPVLVFQSGNARMAWFERPASASDPFIEHLINDPATGTTEVPAHSLGTGDIDGDGLADVVISRGWWHAPEWTWIPANLGPDCAQMVVFDVDGDGRNDVVSSSAHAVGVWWYQQQEDGSFVQHVIDESFSQSHALAAADLNRDGLPDIVTGKRLWAHGLTGDVDPDGPRVLSWFELQRGSAGVSWIGHQIDDSSGVGTQFEATDVNGDGRADIAVSNKTGVHLFLQAP